MSKVPGTQQRFAGAIENAFKTQPHSIWNCAAAEVCADIHQAELLEMLDDLEQYVDPQYQAQFQALKQRYEQ